MNQPRDPLREPVNGLVTPWRGALRIAGAYVALATVWIALSDLFVQEALGMGFAVTRVEIAKGLAFVTVTGLALFFLVRSQLAAQRALVERRLADEQWFRALVENAEEVFSILDEEGRPVYRSPAFQRILGYDSAEARRLRFRDLVHPSDEGVVEEAMEKILRMPYRTTPRLWIRLRARDGGWRVCEAVATNLLEHPAVRGIVVNWRERQVPPPDEN